MLAFSRHSDGRVWVESQKEERLDEHENRTAIKHRDGGHFDTFT